MAGLSTGAGAPVVKVYHEKSMILPDVSRVLACLYEKDVQFETVKDSYKDILRLQATRSVPVPFYDGPTFRQESRAICRYIAETYEQRGYPFLLGKDVLERASIEQWLRHEEHAFDPPSRALFCHLAFPLQDEDISDLDREKRKLEEVLEVYEQRLGESEFLAGNKFTLADLVHLPNTHHIVTSDKFAYLYDSRKNVQRWWNTISARDSWQQVVKDMQSVEEQYQMEELELEEEQFQQQQWHTEPPQPSGGRNIRIDSRKQTGPQSRTILVPPPRDGITSSSFFTVPQEHQPLPAETTSHGKTSPDQRKENNFFNTTEKTPSPSKQRTSATQKSPSSAQSTTSNFTPATPPTTTKMFQRTDSDKSTSKDTSSPNRTSQGSSKEAPDRLHLSDFYQTSNHTEEAAIHTKPTSREASKTSDRVSQARQTSEAPNKPSPGSAKAPQEIAPDKTTEESFSTIQSTTSTFFTPATREIAPDKTTQKSSRSVQSTTSTFFTPAIPPTTTKMPQRTDTGKSTSKDASSPTRPSEGLSKEAPDKLHLSDFYKARSHTDEAPTLTKPTPQEAPKTSDRIYTPHQTSEAVAPDKPSLASAKAPRRIDGPDFYETERKTTSVDPWADNQVPYTKPDDSQKPRSPYTRPAAQRAADTSGAKAGETPSDQRSAVQTPYAQQPYEQAKKAATDQRAAAAKDVQGETAPQARYRGAEDNTKEAREADQKKAASAPTRELPSGSQNTPQQSKAPPTDPKVSNLSPMQAEYEDAQGGNERFSTKRLRKMLEKSDEALKLQSMDLQVPPEKEETPSVYKKPPHVQDRKGQADNLSVDGRTDGTPSTGTRAPDTPTSAAERRAISALKGGMSPDGDGATEPRKSPSINEQQPAPPMPSQSPTSSVSRASASSNGAAQDDDLAQLSTIDQWRHTSTPVTEQGPPGAPSIDKLVKTGGVDRRAQPSPPKKTTTEQSDKSHMDERTPIMTPRQAPPSNTRRTSASTLPSQEPVSSLQQTTKPVKGLTPASYGITGEESANIAMTDESRTPPAPLQTPASDGRRVSTDLQGRILDARGENEAVKPVTDPRGIPTVPKKQELTPGVQRRTNTTSDQPSDKAPLLPSFADARNEKTGITEASQTTTTGPDEKPGRRAPKNSGDKLISSNNIGKQTTEAVYDRSSATSREMPPLVQENSMRQQQLQSENSGISPQDNRRQGSEAALPVSGTQQPKRRELLTNADQNSGRTPGQALQESEEQTSPDTQQVKYNRMNRESDGSRKPTQFDGNEGDVPKSQRGSSSTNP